VGSENFGSEGLGLSFIEGENTGGFTTVIILSFESIVAQDGSHEKIITTSLEVGWDDSFVCCCEGSLLEWVEDTFGLDEVIMGMMVMVVMVLDTSGKTKES
jgi:hypothetical protein